MRIRNCWMVGATWSLFNCTTKGSITNAPTQSGYFYQGGASDSYYTPWDVTYGNKHLNWKEKHWMTCAREKYKWEYEQGPCPSGYKVPVASHYSAIKSATGKIHYLHMEDMCMMIVVRLRKLLLVGSGIQKAMRL